MNKNTLLIIFLALILIVPVILAQDGIKIPDEPAQYVPQTESWFGAGEFLFLSLSLISLIIGIIITVFMIKNSPRTFNLIINGLIIVFAIISLMWGLFSSLSIGHFDQEFFSFWIPVLPLYFLSAYFLINSIKKDKFNESKKYSLNLFSGGIITSILIIMSSAIVYLMIFPSHYYGLEVVMIELIAVGCAILSFILGIVGLFIDYLKNK